MIIWTKTYTGASFTQMKLQCFHTKEIIKLTMELKSTVSSKRAYNKNI